MSFIDDQKARIKTPLTKIVFPEGSDPRIAEAARRVQDEEIAIPILLGSPDGIAKAAEEAGVDLSDIEQIDPAASARLEDYVARYSAETRFPAAAARVLIKKPLGFGAAMTRFGDADGMVAGIANTTASVIQNCRQIIGMDEGITTPSSMMVMDTPHYRGEEGNAIVFADPGVNPNPTSEQLAEIAIATSRTVRRMLEWEPRVAMLSFSTQGSANHPDVDKVKKALEIVREREPELLVDGEMQADAAIVPSVAAAKMKSESKVAGHANVLIFPTLDASNISFKLVQRLGEAGAYGPFLQGFARTASDLSRGSTPDDVVGVTLMAALEAQGRRGSK